MRRLHICSVKIRALLSLLSMQLLTGCSRSPSFNILGSYFPGWILCIVLAIGATALLHTFLKHLQWKRSIPALPLFYVSMALLIACSFYLIGFE